MVFLSRGDVTSARAAITNLPSQVDPAGLVAYVSTYYDLFWLLDNSQRTLLLRLTPANFDGDRGSWGLALAGGYSVEGDSRRALAYADSARVAVEQQMHDNPEDPQIYGLHGVTLAYLGKKAEAIREGERSVEMLPVSRNAFSGAYYLQQLARIYTMVGEPDKAIDRLEELLKVPYFVSPGWLRVDPTFDPLRKNPRFQKLVNGEG
jgi:tetratricopeptide (TPR) repeat protein